MELDFLINSVNVKCFLLDLTDIAPFADILLMDPDSLPSPNLSYYLSDIGLRSNNFIFDFTKSYLKYKLNELFDLYSTVRIYWL